MTLCHTVSVSNEPILHKLNSTLCKDAICKHTCDENTGECICRHGYQKNTRGDCIGRLWMDGIVMVMKL